MYHKCSIDYLSFTFPKLFDLSHHETLLDNVSFFVSTMNLHIGSFSTPKNFYRYTYDLDDNFGRTVGFVAFGGNGGSVNFTITGIGCSRFSRVTFLLLKSWFETFFVRITRLDICYDMDSPFNVELEAAENGEYNAIDSGSNLPLTPRKLRLIKDFSGSDGNTLYIGSRNGATYTRIYEKGKQLGNPSSNWVRVETEFRSNLQIIDYNALVQPDLYFASVSYRHSELLSLSPTSEYRFNSRKRAMVDSSNKIIEHIKISYGQYINVLRGCYSDKELLDLIQREGIPSRLFKI